METPGRRYNMHDSMIKEGLTKSKAKKIVYNNQGYGVGRIFCDADPAFTPL